MRHVLEVHFGRKGFGYLVVRERLYKFILDVFIVLEYKIMNFRPFRDRFLWVSILLRKRLDLRLVLEVHFGRKGFGYLDIRE